MHKQNIITLSLIISGLAINPVVADSDEIIRVNKERQNITRSVSNSISSILYDRGIDKEKANEMAQEIVNKADEVFLSLMIQMLEQKNIVTHGEVLEYLSTAALYREKIDFKQYDNLVGMVRKIKKEVLNQNTLKELSSIAKMNKQLFV
ncbi:MAG: hypothetical protein U9O64_01805 [Campylobacterota bacterium]|nr:hypothetical protein [Campylobacterota bacterium]